MDKSGYDLNDPRLLKNARLHSNISNIKMMANNCKLPLKQDKQRNSSHISPGANDFIAEELGTHGPAARVHPLSAGLKERFDLCVYT